MWTVYCRQLSRFWGAHSIWKVKQTTFIAERGHYVIWNSAQLSSYTVLVLTKVVASLGTHTGKISKRNDVTVQRCVVNKQCCCHLHLSSTNTAKSTATQTISAKNTAELPSPRQTGPTVKLGSLIITTFIWVRARMGRHMASFATRMNPMETSSLLFCDWPLAAAYSLTSRVNASMASLDPTRSSGSSSLGPNICECKVGRSTAWASQDSQMVSVKTLEVQCTERWSPYT